MRKIIALLVPAIPVTDELLLKGKKETN